MTRPRPAIVVLMMSVCALIVTPLVVAGTSSSHEVANVGERPITATPAPAPRFVPGEPQFAFERVTPMERSDGPAPAHLHIPRLGIDAPIVPTGVAEDGQAEVPEDVMTVGWYRFGQRPSGDAGSTVLIAHRDGRAEGRGVFFALENARVGDEITVEDAEGTSHRYEVVSRESIDKAVLPVDELFTRTGEPMLVLISCGGEYRANQGGYQANIVVVAQPVGGRT